MNGSQTAAISLPYLRRRPIRLALYGVLACLFIGILLWRFAPMLKYGSNFEQAIAQKRVVVGMTRQQVLASWGSPYTMDVTYTDAGTRRELWIFEDWINSATVKHRYLYFEEDSLVGGWY
jgi:hypothetical protein